MTYKKPEPLTEFEQEQVGKHITYSKEFLSLITANSTLVDTVSHEGYNWIDGNQRGNALVRNTKTIEIYRLHGKGADTTQKYSMYFICWHINFYTAAFLKTAYDLAEFLFKEDDILNIECYEENRQPNRKADTPTIEQPAALPVSLTDNRKVNRPAPLTDAESKALINSVPIEYEVFDGMFDYDYVELVDTPIYHGATYTDAIVPQDKKFHIVGYNDRETEGQRYSPVFIFFNDRLYIEQSLIAAYNLVNLIGRQDDLKAWAQYDSAKNSRKKPTKQTRKKAA